MKAQTKKAVSDTATTTSDSMLLEMQQKLLSVESAIQQVKEAASLKIDAIQSMNVKPSFIDTNVKVFKLEKVSNADSDYQQAKAVDSTDSFLTDLIQAVYLHRVIGDNVDNTFVSMSKIDIDTAIAKCEIFANRNGLSEKQGKNLVTELFKHVKKASTKAQKGGFYAAFESPQTGKLTLVDGKTVYAEWTTENNLFLKEQHKKAVALQLQSATKADNGNIFDDLIVNELHKWQRLATLSDIKLAISALQAMQNKAIALLDDTSKIEHDATFKSRVESVKDSFK